MGNEGKEGGRVWVILSPSRSSALSFSLSLSFSTGGGVLTAGSGSLPPRQEAEKEVATISGEAERVARTATVNELK